MTTHPPDHGDKPGDRSSRIFLIVLLAVIVVGIAAFLVFKPNPSHTPVSPSLQQ